MSHLHRSNVTSCNKPEVSMNADFSFPQPNKMSLATLYCDLIPFIILIPVVIEHGIVC